MFWRHLSPGSSVALRDFQALEESDLSTSSAIGGINYEVTSKRHMAIRGTGDSIIAEYLLFNITDDEKFYVLSAIITEPHVELRIYFQPDGFQPGTRATLIDNGFSWLFLEPHDTNSFLINELEYATHPDVPPINDGMEEKQLHFTSTHGPFYGDFLDDQTRQRVPVIIMEYETEQPAINPLLLVIEEGGLDATGEPIEEGGFTSLLLGTHIDTSQLEVFAVDPK